MSITDKKLSLLVFSWLATSLSTQLPCRPKISLLKRLIVKSSDLEQI
jgi:hypothetical protein